MTRSIGILQPVYLPWLGYFEQISVVDHFVILDNVQYTKADWRNRNRIKTPAGPTWLTVPIRRKPLGTLLTDIEVNDDHQWRRKHLLTIEQNYRRAPHIEIIFNDIKDILNSPSHVTLVDLDVTLIRLFNRHLRITTPISLASDDLTGNRYEDPTHRLIDICRVHDANILYLGQAAGDYLNSSLLMRAGVTVILQDYQHPTYPQLHGAFLSHMSVVDLIANTGPRSPEILRSSPVPSPLA